MLPIPLPTSLVSYQETAQTPLLGSSVAGRSDWRQHRNGPPTFASVGVPWGGPYHTDTIGTSKMDDDPDSHTKVDAGSLQTAIGISQYERPNSERSQNTIDESQSKEPSPSDKSQPTEGTRYEWGIILASIAAECAVAGRLVYHIHNNTKPQNPDSVQKIGLLDKWGNDNPTMFATPNLRPALLEATSAVTSAVTNKMRRTLGFTDKMNTLEDEDVHPMYGKYPIDTPGYDEKTTCTDRAPNTHTPSGTRYHPGSTDYDNEKQ